jgi:hypothetical protein
MDTVPFDLNKHMPALVTKYEALVNNYLLANVDIIILAKIVY